MAPWASNTAIVISWCAMAVRTAVGLEMPALLSSDMVLQREPQAARLWGWTKQTMDGVEVPAVTMTISVTLDGIDAGTVDVDSEGLWQLDLPPQPASTGRHIVISSTTGESIDFTGVAFGDVYLCSGQSNMEMAVNVMENATAEIADSVNYPDLRFFHVRGSVANADKPNINVRSKSTNFNWMVSQPHMFIKPTDIGVFSPNAFPSAACYFFARDLYKSLGGDVPIGFVSSTWSNMPIQLFSSPDALADASCGGTQGASTVQVKGYSNLKASQYVESQGLHPMATSQVWFGMIYPLLNMRLSAVVWYQGESNADDPEGYECLFPAMIADWRRKFELPDLEFYFVQVSTGYLPWGDALSPEMRQAQLAGLRLRGTAVVPSYDLGEPHLGIPGSEPSWPLGALHPRRKQELGRRLSLAVQRQHYGLDVLATGPVFQNFVRGAKAGGMSIAFTSETAAGLHFDGTPDCTSCCEKSPFEVKTADGAWWATAGHEVDGNEVAFTTDACLADVVAVRYAFADIPECGLYNGRGGPDDHTGIIALPFVKSKEPSAGASPANSRPERRQRFRNRAKEHNEQADEWDTSSLGFRR